MGEAGYSIVWFLAILLAKRDLKSPYPYFLLALGESCMANNNNHPINELSTLLWWSS